MSGPALRCAARYDNSWFPLPAPPPVVTSARARFAEHFSRGAERIVISVAQATGSARQSWQPGLATSWANPTKRCLYASRLGRCTGKRRGHVSPTSPITRQNSWPDEPSRRTPGSTPGVPYTDAVTQRETHW
jgi:hypothetical protein